MKRLLLILLLGLIIRILLIPQLGFEGDVAFWKTWSLAATDKGVVWLTQNTNYNYPAGFTLILWLIGKIYALFRDPQNLNQYWEAGNIVYLSIVKSISIISELAIAIIIYRLLSKPEILSLPAKVKKYAHLISLALLLSPAILYDGVIWGQVDTFGVFFVFLAILLLSKKMPILSLVTITVGFLLKMQDLIFMPLFFLYVWQNYSWKTAMKAIAASCFAFIVLTLPFLIAGNLGKAFTLIANNSEWFPLLSLRAYNPWWIASLAKGLETSDKLLTLGIVSAKTLGLILFSISYFLAIIFNYKNKELKNFIFSLVFVSLSFFILPTQSHERYIIPCLALSFLCLPMFFEKFKTAKVVVILFILLNFTILINLNNSLIANYPLNGLPIIGFFSENKPIWSYIISVLNTSVLIALLIYLLNIIPLKFTVFSAVFLLGIMVFINFPYISGKEISLTTLKPIHAQQEYGTLQTNRSLNSMLGPKSWGFLSNNNFFYKKGFATHANSKIIFSLGKKFKKFVTDFGVDTDAGPKASVIFQIYVDDNLAYTSKIMTKSDWPQRTEVSLDGAKTFTLVVNDAGDGINQDHGDWLEPVLYK